MAPGRAQDTFAPQRADVPDDVIWESIPKDFFEECDAQRHTLEVRGARAGGTRAYAGLTAAGAAWAAKRGWRRQHLPTEVTTTSLEREQAHLSRALDMVDSRLSAVIMENYKAFVEGMNRVEQFSADLKTTNFLLRAGRQHLETARTGLTGGGMEIVAKARKLRMLEVMRASARLEGDGRDRLALAPLTCLTPRQKKEHGGAPPRRKCKMTSTASKTSASRKRYAVCGEGPRQRLCGPRESAITV